MTARGLITVLLLAALIPVAMFGTANWRAAAQPDGSPIAHGAPGRPQLGRSAPSSSFGVHWAGPGRREPLLTPGTIPPPRDLPPTSDLGYSGLAAEPARALMVGANGSAAADPARRSDAFGAPFAGGPLHQNPVVVPGPAAVSSGQALVEFIAVMQDMTLQQREEFLGPAVRELKIIVWWNVPGSQTQRLEVFGPDGALYRRYSVAFDGVAAPSKTSVETRLPVGGTWITEYSMFGAWRVDVYLEGQPAPVTSAYFVLNS